MRTVVGLAVMLASVAGTFGQKEISLRISELEKENRIREILVLADSLMKYSVEENNELNYFYAANLKLRYQPQIFEVTPSNLYDSLKLFTQKVPQQGRALMQLLQAEFLSNQYRANQWQYDQKEDDGLENGHLEEFSRHDFIRLIQKNLQTAIESSTSIKRNIADYEQFLSINKPFLRFFPTVTDAFYYRAIQQMQSFEQENVEISEKVFSEAEQTNLPNNLQRVILEWYRQWWNYAYNNQDVKAFIELQRTDFLHSLNNSVNKMEIYENQLQSLIQKYEKTEAGGFILLDLAQHYYSLSQRYSPFDTLTYVYYPAMQKAHTTAKKIVEKYPATSLPHEHAETLLKNIEAPYLSLSVEQYQLAGQNIPMAFTYANLSEITVVLRRIPAHVVLQQSDLQRYGTFREVFRTTVKLPQSTDFYQHTTHWVLRYQEPGSYLIEVIPVNGNESLAIYSAITISGLLFFTEQSEGSLTRMYITEGFKGSPISNGTCELITMQYDRKGNERKFEVLERYPIRNGEVSIPVKKFNEVRSIRIISGADTLWQNFYLPYSGNIPIQQTIQRVEIFTDRAIYRPGQSIQLKGIWYRGNGEEWKVVTSGKLTVSVRDDNYQEIAQYFVSPNNFGSFELSVPIPANIKPGTISLNTPYGGQAVRVEYYRRYTFDGKFTNPDKPAFPGDTVQIIFEASTYSGVTLQNLKIRGEAKFSTQRVWWLSSTGKTIAAWDTVTDGNGQFIVRFVSEKNIDYQNYTITITATTMSGESRDFTHSYYVSATPFTLTPNKTQWLVNESLPTLTLKSINQETITGKVRLSLDLLKPTKNTVVENTLPKADKPLLSREEWFKLIPFMDYNNESLWNNFPSEKNIWSAELKTSELKLPEELQTKLSEGIYRLNMEVMGQKLTTHFRVVNPRSQKLAFPEVFDVLLSAQKLKPGETLSVTFISSVEHLPVWYGITAGNKTIEQKRVIVKNGKLPLTIPISEAHEGSLYINAVAVQFGQAIRKNYVIPVERISKKINLEVVSIRQHLEPGTQQQWHFKLSNKDKPLSKAEVLATMYDQSLDAFVRKSPPTLNLFYPDQNTTVYGLPYRQRLTNQTDRMFYHLGRYEPMVWTFPALQFNFVNVFGMGEKSRNIAFSKLAPEPTEGMVLQNESAFATQATRSSGQVEADKGLLTRQQNQPHTPRRLRSIFNETAFFYPQLQPDENGKVYVKFTTPEAITGWNVELLAHDTEMRYGSFTTTVTTNLPLSVMPLFPRFIYTGDSVVISAMIFNQTDSTLTAIPRAELVYNMQEKLNVSVYPPQVTLLPGEQKSFTVRLQCPNQPGIVNAKIFATAGQYTDGEEKPLPLYPNKQLITNTIGLWGKPESITEFSLADFLPQQPSKPVTVTLELSTNPTWYAIQSLPFFDNPNPRSAFSLIETLFAVQTGKTLTEKYPVIKSTLSVWATLEPDALLSKLQQNPELKLAEIEKTPWFNQAISETEQMRKLSQFLDKNRTDYLTQYTIEQLSKLQTSGGGFSWFPDWIPSQYVTLYVTEYLGRLNQVNPVIFITIPQLRIMAEKALEYLSNETTEEYNRLLSSKVDTSKTMTPYHIVRFLYVKSMIQKNYAPKTTAEMFYYRHARQHAQRYNLYGRATLGLLARNIGDIRLATSLFKGVESSAVVDPKKGLFFRENIRGWEWYQAPIPTHVRIMEFYNQMKASTNKIDAMKIWLLHHKQTHMWNDGISTAEAVFAIVTSGSNWLGNNHPITITLGNLLINSNDIQKQTGTGYFKTRIDPTSMSRTTLKGTINNPNSNPVYGGLYAQFFENFENIKPWQNDLKLDVALFRTTISENQTILSPIDKTSIKTGDKIRVRITIESTRELEFVVLRLPLPACFEPSEQLSGFGQKGGAWYYVENYDERSDFYFYRLKQGVTILEYDWFAIRPGKYSAAPAAIQSLYAPEFSARAKGLRFECKD